VPRDGDNPGYNREFDFDIDGEPSEEEFDITGSGELFGSGILSGSQALESFSGGR
jgi:hypothetical protein